MSHTGPYIGRWCIRVHHRVAVSTWIPGVSFTSRASFPGGIPSDRAKRFWFPMFVCWCLQQSDIFTKYTGIYISKLCYNKTKYFVKEKFIVNQLLIILKFARSSRQTSVLLMFLIGTTAFYNIHFYINITKLQFVVQTPYTSVIYIYKYFPLKVGLQLKSCQNLF